MDTVSLREFLDEKLKAINEKADKIIELQGITNGRVRKNEIAIAVLQWAYGIGAAAMGAYFLDLIKH